MTIEDEAPLIIGKIYFLKSTTNRTQRVGKLYKNPISLTDKIAWLAVESYEFVCFAISEVPFLLLEIGESSLVEINSDPPLSFNETWLKILYEDNVGWIKVDMFQLQKWNQIDS